MDSVIRCFSPATQELLSNYKMFVLKLEQSDLSYEERIDTVFAIWQSANALLEKSSEDAVFNIVHRLLRHTWQAILLGEWSKYPKNKKEELNTLVSACIPSIPPSLHLDRCKYLLKMCNDPWNHPTLTKILTSDKSLSDDEEKEFHINEVGNMMVQRLLKLCDTGCEELAFAYVKSCLKYIKIIDEASIKTRELLFDYYLAMLLLFDEVDKCVEELQNIDLKEGVDFIRRHKLKKDVASNDSSEIRQYLVKTTELATHVFLCRAVKKPLTDRQESFIFLNILSEWMQINKPTEKFEEMLRQVCSLATSSQHLYYCAKIVEKLADRYLAVETYIRGITLDLNEIEMKRYDGAVKAENIVFLEAKLSSQYIQLANLFNDNEHIKRECLLTAFSLRPTKLIFEMLQKNRIQVATTETQRNNNGCQHDQIVDAAAPISKRYCKYCGCYVVIDDKHDAESESFLSSEALKSIPQYLHNDLAIVLDSPRIKLLSWSKPWEELEKNCQKLMNEEEKISFCGNSLISSIDNLQYLELDYSAFRHLPESGYPGIEKGYEQYLEDSDDETESSESEPDYRGRAKRDYFGGDTSDYSEGGKRNRKVRKKIRRHLVDVDSDDDGQPKRKKKRKLGGETLTRGPKKRIFTNLKLKNIPLKKRLLRADKVKKTKVTFSYDMPHARFYILCRKAQLDAKQLRIKLTRKRSANALMLIPIMKQSEPRIDLIQQFNERLKQKAIKRPKPGETSTDGTLPLLPVKVEPNDQMNDNEVKPLGFNYKNIKSLKPARKPTDAVKKKKPTPAPTLLPSFLQQQENESFADYVRRIVEIKKRELQIEQINLVDQPKSVKLPEANGTIPPPKVASSLPIDLSLIKKEPHVGEKIKIKRPRKQRIVPLPAPASITITTVTTPLQPVRMPSTVMPLLPSSLPIGNAVANTSNAPFGLPKADLLFRSNLFQSTSGVLNFQPTAMKVKKPRKPKTTNSLESLLTAPLPGTPRKRGRPPKITLDGVDQVVKKKPRIPKITQDGVVQVVKKKPRIPKITQDGVVQVVKKKPRVPKITQDGVDHVVKKKPRVPKKKISFAEVQASLGLLNFQPLSTPSMAINPFKIPNALMPVPTCSTTYNMAPMTCAQNSISSVVKSEPLMPLPAFSSLKGAQASTSSVTNSECLKLDPISSISSDTPTITTTTCAEILVPPVVQAEPLISPPILLPPNEAQIATCAEILVLPVVQAEPLISLPLSLPPNETQTATCVENLIPPILKSEPIVEPPISSLSNGSPTPCAQVLESSVLKLESLDDTPSLSEANNVEQLQEEPAALSIAQPLPSNEIKEEKEEVAENSVAEITSLDTSSRQNEEDLLLPKEENIECLTNNEETTSNTDLLPPLEDQIPTEQSSNLPLEEKAPYWSSTESVPLPIAEIKQEDEEKQKPSVCMENDSKPPNFELRIVVKPISNSELSDAKLMTASSSPKQSLIERGAISKLIQAPPSSSTTPLIKENEAPIKKKRGRPPRIVQAIAEPCVEQFERPRRIVQAIAEPCVEQFEQLFVEQFERPRRSKVVTEVKRYSPEPSSIKSPRETPALQRIGGSKERKSPRPEPLSVKLPREIPALQRLGRSKERKSPRPEPSSIKTPRESPTPQSLVRSKERKSSRPEPSYVKSPREIPAPKGLGRSKERKSPRPEPSYVKLPRETPAPQSLGRSKECKSPQRIIKEVRVEPIEDELAHLINFQPPPSYHNTTAPYPTKSIKSVKPASPVKPAPMKREVRLEPIESEFPEFADCGPPLISPPSTSNLQIFCSSVRSPNGFMNAYNNSTMQINYKNLSPRTGGVTATTIEPKTKPAANVLLRNMLESQSKKPAVSIPVLIVDKAKLKETNKVKGNLNGMSVIQTGPTEFKVLNPSENETATADYCQPLSHIVKTVNYSSVVYFNNLQPLSIASEVDTKKYSPPMAENRPKVKRMFSQIVVEDDIIKDNVERARYGSNILDRRNYDKKTTKWYPSKATDEAPSSAEYDVNDGKIKILERHDYCRMNNETSVTGEPFFRNKRLIDGIQQGQLDFFLNTIDRTKPLQLSKVCTDFRNDRKSYKNLNSKMAKFFNEHKSPDGNERKEKVDNYEEKKNVKEYLLATVPGLGSFEFFEMPSFHRRPVVEIVHVAKGASCSGGKEEEKPAVTSNASSSSESTVIKTTPVTAHIQRIGQPSTSQEMKQEVKPEPEDSKSSIILVPDSVTTSNGQNVIINNLKTTKTYQAISTIAGTSTVPALTTTSTASSSQHLLQILNSPPAALSRNKTLNLVAKDESSRASNETTLLNNGIVQFICKTDGKVIHLTPIAGNVVQQQQQSTGQAIVATTTAATTSVTQQNVILNSLLKKPSEVKVASAKQEEESGEMSTRSIYEENYANFIRTGTAGTKTNSSPPKVISVVVSSSSGALANAGPSIIHQISGNHNPIILQNNKVMTSTSLPKFNQVFGKTVFQADAKNSGAVKKLIAAKDEKKTEQTVLYTTNQYPIQLSTQHGQSQSIVIQSKNATTSSVTRKAETLPPNSFKLIATATGGQSDAQTLVAPLRISVPLIPRAANLMQTRIVRPIIQFSPNVLKTMVSSASETTPSSSVVIATTPRSGQNIRLENLLVATTQQPIQQPAKSVDNSTLEQLREFDMVLEQVKERSTSVPSSPQQQSKNNQVTVINHTKPSTSSNTSVQPKEIVYASTTACSGVQKVNLTFLQQTTAASSKQTTPLVVVTNQPTSPTHSITSQGSSSTTGLASPTGSSKSTPNTPQKVAGSPASKMAIKPIKPPVKTMHSPGKTALAKPAQKPQEDEQTVQRIYDILAEYAEQLRNSPDLNNKPAPRRRSNPPTNPATPSSKKKRGASKKPSGGDMSSDMEGTMESEDSSCGVGSVSGIPSCSSLNNFSPSEDLTLLDEHSDASVDVKTSSSGYASRSTSKVEPQKTEERPVIARQLVFSEGSGGEPRNILLAKESQPEVNKTAVLMPGNYLLPVNILKSGQQIAILTSSNGSKILAAVSNAQGAGQTRTATIIGNISQQQQQQPQPKSLEDHAKMESEKASKEKSETTPGILCLRTVSNNSSLFLNTTAKQNTQQVAGETVAVAQQPTLANSIIIASPKGRKRYIINDSDNLLHVPTDSEASSKPQKSSPILLITSNSADRCDFKSDSDSDKEKTLVTTSSSNIITSYAGKIILSDRKIVSHDIPVSRSTAAQLLERDLRLQKSLSEECEDLGVDEPSTSDLFPEADLLFDTHFDQSSQENALVDTPKSDKLGAIFFSDDTKPRKIGAKKMQTAPVSSSEENDDFGGNKTTTDDDNSTPFAASQARIYEYTDEEPPEKSNSDDNTDAELKFVHKKLNRLQSAAARRKRLLSKGQDSIAAPALPPEKKSKLLKAAVLSTDSDSDDMITMTYHQSTTTSTDDAEDSPLVKDTIPVRRSSSRGHVKKNCPCCLSVTDSPTPATPPAGETAITTTTTSRRLRNQSSPQTSELKAKVSPAINQRATRLSKRR